MDRSGSGHAFCMAARARGGRRGRSWDAVRPTEDINRLDRADDRGTVPNQQLVIPTTLTNGGGFLRSRALAPMDDRIPSFPPTRRSSSAANTRPVSQASDVTFRAGINNRFNRRYWTTAQESTRCRARRALPREVQRGSSEPRATPFAGVRRFIRAIRAVPLARGSCVWRMWPSSHIRQRRA